MKKLPSASTNEVISEMSTAAFVKNAMFNYGTEVIENRALPRIEDGLKPIQRFLLWSCLDIGGDKFVKSAKIAGHCIASYSPHGDASGYMSMVNLVGQRYKLLEGQGNFGGPTTEAASSRYTEARLHPFARRLMTDLPDLDSVPYEPNYDDTKVQPKYFPTVIPSILLNGAKGIAVGIKTDIPSFNLAEVAEATQVYLKTNNIKKAVAKIIAPDGMASKIIAEESTIDELINTGTGFITYECKYHVEQRKKCKALILTGYAPDFSVTSFLKKCVKLQETDIILATRNETSAKNGDRIVIEFETDEALNKLQKMLREKVHYQMNILCPSGDSVVPKRMSVADVITTWSEIRKDLTIKTIDRQISKLTERKKREETKLLICQDLKKLFKCLEATDAEGAIKKAFSLNDEQVNMIMEMKIESLKAADVAKLKVKIAELEMELIKLETSKSNPEKIIIDEINDFIKYVKKDYPELLQRNIEIA